MKKLVMATAAACMMAATPMAFAEMGVGVKAGTLGYGAEFTYGINDSFNARLGLNTYSFSETATESDIKYDMDMDWQTTGAFLDWHPLKGSLRLTLGYMFNANEIAMQATPTGTVDIGGVSYAASEVGKLNGTVDFGDGLFYGIGWGNAGKGKGFGFVFELGILMQDPDLSLVATGPIADDATFQSDLRREEKDAQSDLDEFDQYPVVSLGVSYSF